MAETQTPPQASLLTWNVEPARTSTRHRDGDMVELWEP